MSHNSLRKRTGLLIGGIAPAFTTGVPNAESLEEMLRITDLPGPSLRFEGALSGPEVDAAAEHCAALLEQHDRIEIDLAFLSNVDRAGISWLRSLPRARVTMTRAPIMIEELLREEGVA